MPVLTPWCGRKDFCTFCCCLLLLLLLLLLKRVAQPWPLKGGVKPRQGKPGSVIKTRTRTELGPKSCLTHWKLPWRKRCLLWRCASTVSTIVLKNGSKTVHFHVKMDRRVAPRSGTRLIEHQFAII